MSSRSNWSLPIILLHWLSALTIFALFAVGWWMVDLDYYSSWYHQAPMLHKSIGMILLFATLLRIACRFMFKSPQPLASHSRFEQLAAKSAQGLLYCLLLTILFSGYFFTTADEQGIAIFNWFTIPSLLALSGDTVDWLGLIHKYSAYAIIALAVLHAWAGIKHQFIDKDKTLTRMLKP